jgi:hypothetical protein
MLTAAVLVLQVQAQQNRMSKARALVQNKSRRPELKESHRPKLCQSSRLKTRVLTLRM